MPQRTTLTLDDDVAARLHEEARRSGEPLRSVVNDALRAGLEKRADRAPRKFSVTARRLGLRPGFDLDHIEGIIERIEGPAHR